MKYVSLIQDGRIETSKPTKCPCSYSTDQELAAAVLLLIEEGFSFVDQPAGWPPAAIVQVLQEKGLVHGAFTAITWSEPGVFRTFEVPAC